MKPAAFVAMSGGVDSTACAIILQRQGYAVSGITMEQGFGDACERAASACRKLGIEHHIVDLRGEFMHVQRAFCDEYLAGRTPNPCVVCNREIKFGALMDEALRLGAQYFSTGHYARVDKGENGVFMLKTALNTAKDQSYVLYTLDQARLSRVLFPLGSLSKSDTRRIVCEAGLEIASAPESQDICFVPNGDYAGFIEGFAAVRAEEGDFVNLNGATLGRHRGIIHYTVGQRRGTGVSAGHPLYVLSKNAEKNTVTLGSESDLLQCGFSAENVCWTAPEHVPAAPFRAGVRTRYHQRELACTVYPLENARVKIELDIPARAPAPGQSAVFYRDSTVLGGGIIV